MTRWGELGAPSSSPHRVMGRFWHRRRSCSLTLALARCHSFPLVDYVVPPCIADGPALCTKSSGHHVTFRQRSG